MVFNPRHPTKESDMKKTGNTILITGGSTGIGLSLAVRFLETGNRVLICGRRKDRLAEAEKAHPSLRTYVCDVSKQADREALGQGLSSGSRP